jgi:hypothetical protein
MLEYDIYLPATRNDGQPIEEARIRSIKEALTQAFGGFTHLNHSSEGVWKVGDFTYRDEVTIVRVLGDEHADMDMPAFKQRLEHLMEQKSVLIVRREVEVV